MFGTVLRKKKHQAEIPSGHPLPSTKSHLAPQGPCNAEIASLINDYREDAANQLVRLHTLTDGQCSFAHEEDARAFIIANPKQAAMDLRHLHSMVAEHLPSMTFEEARLLVMATNGIGFPPVAFLGDVFASVIGNAAVYEPAMKIHLARLEEAGCFGDLDPLEKAESKFAQRLNDMSIKEVAALAVALNRFWHAKGLKFGPDPGIATYFKLQG